MATLTREDVARRALEHLGVKAIGVASPAEDRDVSEEAFDQIFEEMVNLDLAPFASSAVPEYAQAPFRDMVAFRIAPSFGVPPQRRAELERGAIRAERQLTKQLRGPSQPDAEPYFF